jgi:HSP20 family protein
MPGKIATDERKYDVMTSLAPRRGRQLNQQQGRQGRQGRRGDPLAELEDRMGDLIQSFFADPFAAAPAVVPVPVWVPAFDIEETEDAYILEMDLPGVKPEDVNMELREGNVLRITGNYHERERTGTMRRQGRRGGDFEYDVVLPGDVNAEQIDATLEDGVLTVRLGKAQPQARRIQVRGGGTAGQVGGTGTAAAGGGASGRGATGATGSQGRASR